MAKKAGLEAREAGCASAKDYAELATEASQEPTDPDYAKHLLQQGEMQCQFPADYTRIAEVAVAAGDSELALGLYDQAEEFCMEGKEFAEVANSLATHTEKKARMLYDQAAGLAGDPAGTIEYATGLVALFEDKECAEELLAAVQGDCMFPGQYVALAEGYRTLLDNTDKAAELLQQGKEFAMSGEENLDLANGYAAEKCGDAVQFGQLVSQLRSFGESLQLQRELYGIG